jgi:hypothetical protein
MLLCQRHVFFSLLALKPVACPTMWCPQTFVPFRPRPPLPRGAWTRIHGGLGDAASRLSSWPAQGDAAILDATPTVSLESSRNVGILVNWTRNGRSRDARNRTSQSQAIPVKRHRGEPGHTDTRDTHVSPTSQPTRRPTNMHTHDHATTPETTEPHGRPNPDKNPDTVN